MLSSVLSKALVFVLISPNAGLVQMNQKDRHIVRQLMPSIASIVRGRDDVGMAALVDNKGLFLTHLDSVYANKVKARLNDGRVVDMILVASDDPSQLAVLQAQDWIREARPLTSVGELHEGDSLIAVLPSRRIHAEYMGAKSGLVASSRRITQLSEINFEASANTVGGALVITQQGELVGFLNASLRSNVAQADIQVPAAQIEDTGPVPAMAPPAVVGATGKGGGATRDAEAINGSKMQFGMSKRSYGPGDMTVAYTPAPSVLRKALQSLVQGKEVEHPSIGVDVKNAPEGGALIEKIYPGSGAEQAGLLVGDIVFEINGQGIVDQVDLAKAVMEQQVGATLRVKVRRGQTLLIVPVTVGSKSQKHRQNPRSAT